MRRILFVLMVAALLAAMMVSAGPAQANNVDFGNSTDLVCGVDFCVGDFGDDVFDLDDGIDFGRNCCRPNFGHNGIIFGGIEQDSRSGQLSIGSNVS